MIKTLNSKTTYKNKWMEVFEDDVEFDGGQKGIYGFVKRSDGVDVLIINSHQEILLVKQYRYPIRAFQWGIPGGAMNEGETPKQAAQREIREETGLEITDLEEMGSYYPLSSCSTEKGNLFLARIDMDLPTENPLEQHDEVFQEKKFIPIQKILEMIDSNEITDAYTANAIQMLARRINKS